MTSRSLTYLCPRYGWRVLPGDKGCLSLQVWGYGTVYLLAPVQLSVSNSTPYAVCTEQARAWNEHRGVFFSIQ